ncbi:hypothetical protein XELAEV_18046035mg [Xenopus laevis]|uniref:Uncharacterized protein n=1 Tax=Xenopus laevis TaxID=8355 RepID=A0A974H0K1_XENLA|nr:hypothetical protein XELAEV_18046035mg [Xenopus laevis]
MNVPKFVATVLQRNAEIHLEFVSGKFIRPSLITIPGANDTLGGTGCGIGGVVIQWQSVPRLQTQHGTKGETYPRPPDSVKAKQGSLKCTPGILRRDTSPPPVHSSPRDKTLPISEQLLLMERV